MDISQAFTLILHQGSQILLVPVVVALIVLALVTAFSIGMVISEIFTERRHFKANHKKVIADMRDSDPMEIPDIIANAGLLRKQVRALTNVADNMGLPDDELFALAEVELERVDAVYTHRVNITDTISKVAPMLGLMGTLIPLGPGIVAMGQGDVSQLSSSLLVAFDTTIAGLIAAVVALIISRVRKTWYGQYHTMVQSLMSCILEEAAIAREEGIALPYGDRGDGEASVRSRRGDVARKRFKSDKAQAVGPEIGAGAGVVATAVAGALMPNDGSAVEAAPGAGVMAKGALL